MKKNRLSGLDVSGDGDGDVQDAFKKFEDIQSHVADSIRVAMSPYMQKSSDDLGPAGAIAVSMGIAEAVVNSLAAVAAGAGVSREEYGTMHAEIMTAAGKVANEITSHMICETFGIARSELDEAIESLRKRGGGVQGKKWDMFPFDQLKQILDGEFAGFKQADPEPTEEWSADPEKFFRELFDEWAPDDDEE
ncbi:uncharacterized protein METZ01_LOCUS230870 [marine metagenome]|uniref:Uncharacterized protein n=1 Tax=marine metagenome TaxID=408172 RepID=A0A382GSA7_9ZZZZ